MKNIIILLVAVLLSGQAFAEDTLAKKEFIYKEGDTFNTKQEIVDMIVAEYHKPNSPFMKALGPIMQASEVGASYDPEGGLAFISLPTVNDMILVGSGKSGVASHGSTYLVLLSANYPGNGAIVESFAYVYVYSYFTLGALSDEFDDALTRESIEIRQVVKSPEKF